MTDKHVPAQLAGARLSSRSVSIDLLFERLLRVERIDPAEEAPAFDAVSTGATHREEQSAFVAVQPAYTKAHVPEIFHCEFSAELVVENSQQLSSVRVGRIDPAISEIAD